jgi:hypothetical protein
MQHYDILIATPGAMMESQYVKSLVNTLAECDKRRLTYKFISAYGSLVHHARELTCSGGELVIIPYAYSIKDDIINICQVF